MKDLQKELRLWLIEQLDKRGRGAKGELADHLGVRADAVTRMINLEPGKEDRDISVTELAGIAQFFGEMPPFLLSADRAAIPATQKFLKTSKHRFYVRDWRLFMIGDKPEAAAEAVGMPVNEYLAHETHPINFHARSDSRASGRIRN